VFGSDTVLAGALGFLMSEAENTPCPLCKSFHTSHIFSPKFLKTILPKSEIARV
jgi:hypothetical protein